MDGQGARYFQSQGFDVVYNGSVGLPSDQQAIQPSLLYQWIRAHVPKNADAVFIGGNGFRSIGVIRALEQDLARPVLTANQVAFWQALGLAGAQCRFRIMVEYSTIRRLHKVEASVPDPWPV
jgi:maleate isomerase